MKKDFDVVSDVGSSSRSIRSRSFRKNVEEVNFREFLSGLYGAEDRTEHWQKLMNEGNTKYFEKVLLLPTSDRSKAVKMEALLMIQLMDKEGVSIMKNAFRRGDVWTRSQLVGIFSTMNRSDLTNELVKAVHDRRISLEKRLLALNALTKSVYRNENKLMRLLNNRDPRIRAKVVLLLGKFKSKQVKLRLKRLLMEEYDLGVIKAVIKVLNEVWGENLTIEDVLGLRDGAHASLMSKMKEIARKFGTSVYVVIAAIVSMLISLGYSVKSINNLLATALKRGTLSIGPNAVPEEDEENN